MKVDCRRVDWPFKTPFRISYQTWTAAETVWVELSEGPHTGRGEALGVSYHGETADSVVQQLLSLRETLSKGPSRSDIQSLLAPGGARNAIDCALWDLEAKQTGRRAWELAGISSVAPLNTVFTLGLGTPNEMAEAARNVPQYPALKLKLGGEGDLERVHAVRAAREDVKLIVDANQAWTERQLHQFVPVLHKLGVKLIEQPLRVGNDDALSGFQSPIPICADESCQTTQSLSSLRGKYSHVNIKLDKTGGLTEALLLARAARASGFGLMVGCMAGSSLSMAPAFVVGQLCEFVDLDGPLLAAMDTPDAIQYQAGQMSLPEASLWG